MLYHLLLKLGETVGEFLPWHAERDPFRILLTEKLLQRTARRNVLKVYSDFVANFGTPETLAGVDPEILYKEIKILGLGRQRAQALQVIARTILNFYDGRVPCDRQELIKIPYVGDYIADAVLLYGFGGKAFPLDAGIQRVIRRVFGLPPSRKPPYMDKELVTLAEHLIEKALPEQVVQIHRAVLWLAWETCKPQKPCCGSCPLAICCKTIPPSNPDTIPKIEIKMPVSQTLVKKLRK